MKSKELVNTWFDKWDKGDYHNLPLSPDFKHTSPFGTIKGRREYIDLVAANEEKFLGHRFEIHDEIYHENKACVRYTAVQGEFRLDVSEWYYIKNDLIEEIMAYYHIGEIREDRKLKDL